MDNYIDYGGALSEERKVEDINILEQDTNNKYEIGRQQVDVNDNISQIEGFAQFGGIVAGSAAIIYSAKRLYAS